jgi:transcriptional regulator GlxA family with amidase domain
MSSSLTGLFDLFSVATFEMQKQTGSANPFFKPVVVGPAKREISAFNGMPIRFDRYFTTEETYDIVIAPVIFGDLEPLLKDQETIDWLGKQGHNGACLCSVCAGAFLLAKTGLLAGKQATTHWNLADHFAIRFPEVILRKEKMLVDEGACITAGGVSAYLDLGLYLISRFASFELASKLSKLLLIDPSRRLQTPYQTFSWNKVHGDKDIKTVQDWLEENPDQPVTISALAARAGLGERTFIRRFKRATGETPLSYLQQLRIEKARRLLETTSLAVEEITLKSGYEDISSFRKLFKRQTGLSPSAYRKRFSCRSL